ncbi:MAG: ATP-binding protein [Acidobacteriota bacterium]
MRELDGRRARPYFQLWRQRDGATVAHSESLRSTRLPKPEGVTDEPRLWNLDGPAGPARALAIAFRLPPPLEEREEQQAAPSAALELMVVKSRNDLDRTLATLALVLVGTGGLLLAATIAAVPPLLTRQLAPLKDLTEHAAGINAPSLSTRFQTGPLPEELAPIGLALNALVSRLEQAFERERRFSADVAHELRTPIAELRALAELAMRWPESRDLHLESEALGIAAQMEGVVTRLLALLRSERGELAVTRESADLATVMRRSWRPFAVAAARKHLSVMWQDTESGSVDIDLVLLRSILANLFENAVEYAPANGTVVIGSTFESERFAIRVANTVTALTSADAAQMFDRFWRGDAARAHGDHSGLGLALARAFARAMGGDLEAGLPEASRLTMTLTGPRRGPLS